MDTRNCVGSDAEPESAVGCYEAARAALAIASLPLEFSNPTAAQLRAFIAAALVLCDVCKDSGVPERPFDVLLWLRRRLHLEAKNPARGEFFRAQCLRAVVKVEREIETACVALSGGGLTVLE